MKPLLIVLSLFCLLSAAKAQNSMYVENGYLVLRIKLDENIDLARLSELLNVKSSSEFNEIDDILQTYQDYYRLTGQIFPEWLQNFKENLRLIDRLNKTTIKPQSIGALSIRYHFVSKQVIEIGKMDVKYDFRTNKITQVGDVKIEYHFVTGKVEQIGDLKIEYHPFNGSIRKIGEIDLK